MKRKLAMLLTFVLVGAMLPGCSKKEEEPEPAVVEEEPAAEEPAEPEVVEEPEEVIPENQNLLTGVPDLSEEAIGKRPVAVMVNNIPAAMPQYGVEEADIIFEIPVEGDQTRFMALYADYTKVPKVCAIRSCRAYFPAISQGFDAFYVNWGIDESMGDYIAALGLNQYDGMYNPGGLFGRDQDRINSGYALEHTAYFDGTKFASYVQSEGTRTDLQDDKKDTAFKFNGLEEQVKPTGGDCSRVDINFGAQSAALIYDEQSNTYKKENSGEPQIDGNTGDQLAFTNVIVLETSITVRDDVGHKDVDWSGGNDAVGYYISNGGMQKISWYKQDNNEQDRIHLYDEDGNELSINRGKTYIAFNYPNQTEFQ
ncbi:MAG TPA: DUF3048 domain-containing protein [Candidatus Mediterraneibacter intestinavium]|nr:DUF3048 domain-containing protein [Candidatus Mediterraneibacter intestinavium]